MNWFDQPQDLFKLWAESQKSLFQALAESQVKPSPEGGPTMSPVAGFEHGMSHLNDLWESSMAAWAALAQQGVTETGSGAFDPGRLSKLFDPAEWAQAGVGTSPFDLALEHLTKGPTYATLWDLDRKILNAQKLWLQRSKDVAAYYALVQTAWVKAFDQFVKETHNPDGAPIESGRALIDLWVKVANDALLEMHRSEAFLEAQRRMTRSSTEYRLQEREIAEAFCAMHHIPTRTEVDEVQRMVWAKCAVNCVQCGINWTRSRQNPGQRRPSPVWRPRLLRNRRLTSLEESHDDWPHSGTPPASTPGIR